jgi:hypothetical protein
MEASTFVIARLREFRRSLEFLRRLVHGLGSLLGNEKTAATIAAAADDFGFLRTYFAHNLSSDANCSRISTTRFSFSGPSF